MPPTVCFLLLIWHASMVDGSSSHEQNAMSFSIKCDPYAELKFEGDQECKNETLAKIASSVNEQINVQIDVYIPLLLLNETAAFTNLTSLTINGGLKGIMTNISCVVNGSSNDAGIILSNITEYISLNNLRLLSCGSISEKRNTENFYDSEYSSALTIIHGRNVNLDKVVIERSKGLGLTILDHQGGEVNIVSSVFKENKVEETSVKQLGGGGVYIELEPNCPTCPDVHKTFTFEDCLFYNNTAITNDTLASSSVHTEVFNDKKQRNGRGGGAYVLLRGGTTNIRVLFSRCTFRGNQGLIGGGLSVNMLGENNRNSTNVTVEIRDSQFESNGCTKHNSEEVRDMCGASPDAGFGGGLQLTFNAFSNYTAVDDAAISHSRYLVRNSNFTKNCAVVGGGVSYLSYRWRTDTVSMSFDDCIFDQNTAHMGSAVAMTPSRFSKMYSGNIVIPHFHNCLFSTNFIFDKCFQSFKAQENAGIGTVYSSSYNIDFQGSNDFENNWGSAIHIVNGILNFTASNVNFINNTAQWGGALALFGDSTMIVGSNKYNFILNMALIQGGAIYVNLIDKADFTISRSCFIYYNGNRNHLQSSRVWHTNITFHGNIALKCTGGHAIYATSLHSCQGDDSAFKSDSKLTFANISEVLFGQGVTLDNNDTLQPQIMTDGAWLELNNSTPLEIIPGKRFHHGLKVKDDFGHYINVSFKVIIDREATNVSFDPSYSTFVKGGIKLSGSAGNNASILLSPVGPRYNYVKLNVTLLKCPPGYKLNGMSQCTCNTDAHFGLLKCDNFEFKSYLLPGFWVGLIDESTLVTSNCYFCVYNNSISSASSKSVYEVLLPQSYSELNKAVCGETRTGVVCGVCQKGYTVHFHSPHYLCKQAKPFGCKLGWFFYILSELVPGTAVFVFVLVFNISFTSGAINGFILFSQLLGSLDLYAGGVTAFSIADKQKIDDATAGSRILYGFFNLDFFNSEALSFCLWQGATALDMIAFRYITIFYTVLLVVAVIFVMNKCGGRCLSRCCRITTVKVSVIHGISTFLVICYAQCVKVSLSLLVPVHLHTESNFRLHSRVWFNGEVRHLSPQHLPYAIPAILILLTIGILPPSLLLTYPMLNKLLAFLALKKRDHSTSSFL